MRRPVFPGGTFPAPHPGYRFAITSVLLARITVYRLQADPAFIRPYRNLFVIFKILGIPVTVYILEHGSVPHMMAVNHMNPFVMDVMIGFQENRARLALVSIDITVQKPLIVLLVLDVG